MTGIDLLQRLRPKNQQQPQPDAIDASSSDTSDAPPPPTEYVLDRAPTQTAGDRLHAKCGGRYVSVVRLNSGGLACVDSICYHAGGNSVWEIWRPRLICPQHRFRVCLRTGDATEGGGAHAHTPAAACRLRVRRISRVRLGTGGDVAGPRCADETAERHDGARSVARPVE